MSKIVVIIGYGSAGQRHAKLLKTNKKISKIHILSSKKNIPFNKINNVNEIKKINPDMIVIATYSKDHLKYILYVEKYFKKKIVLIEKPLFNTLGRKKFLPNKNLYFVGYNLRFHPIISFIQKAIKNKKIWFFKAISYSYLPNWRTNIPYYKSASAKKEYGGGALLELSHEIDFTRWILGDFKVIFSINKKNSNLKIDTDDQFEILGKNKNCKLLNISANFFSKNLRREIFIESENISIHANLIKNKINIIKGKKRKQINFKNYDINKTFKDEHNEILSKKFFKVCKFNEGYKVMQYIQKLKGK